MDKETRLSVTATIDGAPYDTRIRIRDHLLHGDEPVDQGGGNAGPKAHEMLCASLASCTAITLRMYVDRKRWPVRAIQVECSMHRLAANGVVNTRLHMNVRVDGDLAEDQRERILQISNMCPVHKTLTSPIAISAELV